MSFTGIVVLALLGVFASVGEAVAKVRVATTTGTLAAIVADVGGELVEVTALSAPTEDPHYVDARPNLVLTLNHADLLVATGLELEVGWLPNLQKSARNPRIGLGGQGYYEAHSGLSHLADAQTGRIDRAQGDIHPGGNPHYLYDPRAAAEVAIGLGTKLAELDPTNAATYVTRAQRVAATYRGLAEAQRARFAALPAEKRRVVSYHASWPYLLDWLALEQVETIEPKPGIAPSPAHVAEVLQRMRATGARAVLQEEFYPRATSEKLSSLAGAKLVVVPGAVRFGTQTYPEFVGQIAEALHAAING
jgi:zinc/manganese transport system substrate-binding protein